MTITVAPDPAQVQASALEHMNRLSREAKAVSPTHYYAVFCTERSQYDGQPYGTIYDCECYATLDKAIEIATSAYEDEWRGDGRLLNITKICVESGSGAVIYNRSQLIDVIEGVKSREALASVNPHDEFRRRQSPHYDDAEW